MQGAPMNSKDYIELDEKYGAHNYHPLPVVISWAEGVRVKDPEGKSYFDFLSAYSAVNQGHRHPRIIKALVDQASVCTLTSRAFHNDKMGQYLQKLCEYTGYEHALPMNTGAEAVETAIKAARRWGVEVKGVDNGNQEIVCVKENFHGRTLAAITMSNDPDSTVNYGPYVPGFVRVPYEDIDAMAAAINANTVAVILEPIQGEAGVCVPYEGYLAAVRALCTKHQVLFICDEVQTGFCRTGKRFAWMHEDARPDIMCLGKALGGGVFPVSAIVADHAVMQVFTPGTHGSTFGGNPLASAVAMAALDVLVDEKLDEHAEAMGQIFRAELAGAVCKNMVKVRGKGLLNAVLFKDGFQAWDVCLALRDAGLLAKQTHGNIIRFAPPLVITEAELREAIAIIKGVLVKY
ncbi:MAG TPA: ornithine--oxo-acid transaminase [Spirochaetaceae bacterium]|nr:ornithine--oxo-acid transaminase [Spirochaetaceae bacterium]HAX37429.1 ornithine--oxo-acid transaminase [Spirochaetaceae bacterium]HBO41181.1 ornithine--oxo-acid transaminase [Spirochaetaceae bacterium]